MIHAKDFFHTFRIGTYYLQKNARTDAHIKDLCACGIDFVIGVDYDKDALDLLHDNGVGVVISGVLPEWFGGAGKNAGTMHTQYPKEMFMKRARHFTDHPAIVAVNIGDEPSCLDFPYYGSIVKLLQEHLHDKLLYLNIYPSYGMRADADRAQATAELGAATYREYIRSYCENIDLPYLCFDHYVYTSSPARLLQDLCVVSDCCREYRRRLMVVLQVNSREKDVFLTIDQLRFQAFCALSFGAAAITWACYSAGWWHNHVLDRDGQKTEQYEKLKTVNTEVRAICTELMDFHALKTEILSENSTTSFDVFCDIHSSARALIGMFTHTNGSKGIFYYPLAHDNSPCTLFFRYTGNVPLYCRDTYEKHMLTELENGMVQLVSNRHQPLFVFFA